MIVNRAGEELFHKKASQLEGTALEKVIPELEQRYIDDVLSGKRDSFMTSVYVAGVPMMLTAARSSMKTRFVARSFHSIEMLLSEKMMQMSCIPIT